MGRRDMELEVAGGMRLYRSYARARDRRQARARTTIARWRRRRRWRRCRSRPELAIPAVLEMNKRFGNYIYAKYGFLDAFNLSFNFDGPLRMAAAFPDSAGSMVDYLGIDQGAIFAMIENYRSDMIWRVMHTNPYVRSGLQRAGFSGGWLTASR